MSFIPSQLTRLLCLVLSVWGYTISMPGGDVSWLAWVALVPLHYGMAEIPRRTIWLYSGLWGWLIWLTNLWWAAPALHHFLKIPPWIAWAGVCLYCLWMSLPYALYGLLFHLSGGLRSTLNCILLTALYVLPVSCFPSLFPGNLAHSQFRVPVLLQTLEWGGTPMLLFLMVLINVWLSRFVWHWVHQRQFCVTPVILCGMLMLSLWTWGTFRIDQIHEAMNHPETPVLQVGLIQPNLERSGNVREALELTRELAHSQKKMDLILWPEIPVPFSWVEKTSQQQQINQLVEELQTPLAMVSSYVYERTQTMPDGRQPYYNMAHLIAPGQVVAQHYAKRRLVPFTEYLPFENQWSELRQWFPGVLRYIPGDTPQTFRINSQVNAIPLICYEAIFADMIRDFERGQPTLMINMTNDRWFGLTRAPWLHWALAQFRAVEFRMPLIRVSNSGISGYVSPTGETDPKAQTELMTQAARNVLVPVPQIASLYARCGNWFLYLLGLGVVVIFVLRQFWWRGGY
ncbi:MAG: apolipoprotein N-acyltransferase [SAR324 cluster bacterium]|nr:apolipoprotein N-acyltransferase [SAR324 cluster bacterium]